jgi:hypothetical protein
MLQIGKIFGVCSDSGNPEFVPKWHCCGALPKVGTELRVP